MRLRSLVTVSLLAVLSAACAGGGADAGGQPTATDSLATATGAGADTSCDVPGSIKSYRFTSTTKMEAPGLEEALQEIQDEIGAAPEGGEYDALAEMSGGIGALVMPIMMMADMRTEGAFVAPERAEVRMTFLGDLELTGIVVGDRQWIRRGTSEWEESQDSQIPLSFATDLCQQSTYAELTGVEARQETLNGIATLHYRLDEGDLTRLVGLPGGPPAGIWDVEDVPAQGTVDLWLAEDGAWLVRGEVDLSWEYDEMGNMNLSMFVEVKDLNDPDIKIEAPVATLPAQTTASPEGATFGTPPTGGVAGPGVPMFRGNPARTGVNPGPGVEESPTLLWRFGTRFYTEHSPAVVEGRVYTGSHDDCLQVLDAITGEPLSCLVMGSKAMSSPAVVDGVAYVSGRDQYVYALDVATGEQLWRSDVGDLGFSSPAVVDGAVYIGGVKNIYALDAATGEQRWRFETGRIPLFSPAVADGVVYVGSWDSGVHALDATTGEERWHFDMGKPVGSSPAVVDGVVYIGGEGGYMYALDAVTGEERWRSTIGDLLGSCPAVSGGAVYIGSTDAHVYALDANTGEERWRFATKLEVRSSPVVVGAVVYVGSGYGSDSGGDGYVYALDAATGEERWRFDVGDGVESAPAVVGGVVYVSTSDGYVYAIAGE